MGGVLSAMTYFVIKHRRIQKMKRKKILRNETRSWQLSDSDPEVKAMYAI